MIAAATILAEIGDIHRFKNSSALVAFAGIDPTVRQSGEFNSIHNHMSKRDSPYLRHAIYAVLRNGKPYEPQNFVSDW